MSYPSPSQVLLHIDGDAFFASVYQAVHPHTKGKPVAIGKERSIITALSYEAKARGVKRGMLVSEVLRVCPECIVASSDYRLYQLFSNKMVQIALAYSPFVERYSIDEVFVDITGIDKVHGLSYMALGSKIKSDIEKALGITVSAGIGSTKTQAKLASSFYKPSGYVVLNKDTITPYLKKTVIDDVWGIGWRLAPKLKALGIHTAYDFVQAKQSFISTACNKSVLALWYELRGIPIFSLAVGHKDTYQTIRKSRTVTPPTSDFLVLQSRMLRHVESACIKARKLNYLVGEISLFLKTQQFTYAHTILKLSPPIAYPYLIRSELQKACAKIYRPHILYRTTGCTLACLTKNSVVQHELFDRNEELIKRLENIYPLYEKGDISFGSDLYGGFSRIHKGFLPIPLHTKGLM